MMQQLRQEFSDRPAENKGKIHKTMSILFILIKQRRHKTKRRRSYSMQQLRQKLYDRLAENKGKIYKTTPIKFIS